MAYTSLYRRYRPTTFDKLFGQEHIVRTLTNQVKLGKVGHAYLFTGTRGTGKTSTAKIFARAVNCLAPINGSPCEECEVCRALSAGTSMDVLEIDAASNNGVDEIRELRESVAYPPVHGKYKVYIVDEVHMLSTQAFNALLKTLEEPPAHAIFILATTEVHKLPQTILSRCMRFDFRLVPQDMIASHVKDIFDEIGKEYELEAIDAIASAGEGSVRDALSIADMCLSCSDGVLTYSDVLDVLGASDRGTLLSICEGMLAGDASRVLRDIDKTVRAGRNVNVLSRDLTATLRDIMVCVVTGEADKSLPESYRGSIGIIASSTTKDRVLRALSIMASLENDIRYTTSPRVVVEGAALRATLLKSDLSIDGLLQRINALESKLIALQTTGVRVSEPTPKPAPKPVTPTIADGSADTIWGTLVRTLKTKGMYALYSCALEVKQVFIRDNTLVARVDNNTDYNMLTSETNVKEIVSIINSLSGKNYEFLCENTKVDGTDLEAIATLKRNVGEDYIKIH